MATLKSFDLNGKKLSFANWISNLSPQETPFVSSINKEKVGQTRFQWQTDHLKAAGKNANLEGETAISGDLENTTVHSNITQILRKTVKVSDTSNSLANFGRDKELQYQMEKAGREMKRDLEWIFLNNRAQQEQTPTEGRLMSGFRGLVAYRNTQCPDTGAVVSKLTKQDGILSEEDLFDLTYNLYLAGSRADTIMFHPELAGWFSSLQEADSRVRIFENTPKFSVFVETITDPLGQTYKLLPNRFMPKGIIYFFNPEDWTQMILREPRKEHLAKNGSYEKWMLEMECGLRHRHPFASGILNVAHSDGPAYGRDAWLKSNFTYTDENGKAKTINLNDNRFTDIKIKKDEIAGPRITFTRQLKNPIISETVNHVPVDTDYTALMRTGSVEIARWTANGSTEKVCEIPWGALHESDNYVFVYRNKDNKTIAVSGAMRITAVK